MLYRINAIYITKLLNYNKISYFCSMATKKTVSVKKTKSVKVVTPAPATPKTCFWCDSKIAEKDKTKLIGDNEVHENCFNQYNLNNKND